jgi:hypothetical protein
MRPSLDNIRGLPDFASLYRWNLIFDQPPSGIAAPTTEELNLRCTSATIPKVTGSAFPISIRGHKTQNPGIWDTSGTIVLTFIETVDNKVLNFIQSWSNACWEMNTGISKTKSELTAIVRLERLDRQDNPVREYKLEAFLSDYSPGGDLGADGDTLSPTITLSYDKFEENSI